ncbi:hypothetical protein E2C01_086091 [Portunus trituberculatus]|uniref:Uncharacterized protein n=1 Tax=Portunus trituberculatus TaxID=210409 RepID=A0A5B7JAL3_PORTR|nr:hypothetical protein [Portunus trituberculatus]
MVSPEPPTRHLEATGKTRAIAAPCLAVFAVVIVNGYVERPAICTTSRPGVPREPLHCEEGPAAHSRCHREEEVQARRNAFRLVALMVVDNSATPPLATPHLQNTHIAPPACITLHPGTEKGTRLPPVSQWKRQRSHLMLAKRKRVNELINSRNVR